jgi:hypothetical protein
VRSDAFHTPAAAGDFTVFLGVVAVTSTRPAMVYVHFERTPSHRFEMNWRDPRHSLC